MPWKRWLHICGSALGAAGVIFVIVKLNDYAGQLDFVNFDINDLVVVVACVVIYGLTNIFLSLAWHNLLFFFGVAEVKSLWAIRVYGLSQLAKYVPGNIFHLAGRQAYGMASGISSMSLVKSALGELSLLAVTGSLFGILAMPMVFSCLSQIVACMLYGLIVSILAASIWYFMSRSLSIALLWQSIFFAISGGIFVVTLDIIVPANTVMPSSLALCGAYVIAWLMGFVTPGAPAGIGIREAVLLFLLGSIVPHADLLFAVLLGRIITVMGDVLYFIASSCVLPLQRRFFSR